MALPPLWKVYRELDRGKQVLQAALGRLYEPYVQRRHDRDRDKILKLHDGTVGIKSKIALYLVYQPRQISSTALLTCDHLVNKGYAPLVVSNSPLSSDDLQRLSDRSWKVMVRPNYGYDFGGYRDGILWMQDSGIVLDRLMILNDSIWFPVWPNETLIDRMEALSIDVVGAVMHPSQRRRRTSSLRPAFIESYFYLLNRDALESESFCRFWRQFPVSSIKYNAVHRGERSFSKLLETGGLTTKGIFTVESLKAAIATGDNRFLAKTLQYAAYTDPGLEIERDAILAQSPTTEGWRQSVLQHVAKVAQRRSAYASFPYAAYYALGLPFVKKSRPIFRGQAYGTVHVKMRSQILHAVQSGDLPRPYPEVFAEIEALEQTTT